MHDRVGTNLKVSIYTIMLIWPAVHQRPIDRLAASQGLLAVGVGDAIAALVGVWVSVKGLAHQLPPPGLPRKTWEGNFAPHIVESLKFSSIIE